MDWEKFPAVERIPSKIAVPGLCRYTDAGLRHVREPVKSSGATIDEFTEWFPGVVKQQVCVVLK